MFVELRKSTIAEKEGQTILQEILDIVQDTEECPPAYACEDIRKELLKAISETEDPPPSYTCRTFLFVRR